MATNDAPPTLLPSIIDRLIDPGSSGTGRSPGYTLEQMEKAILRDLQDLLTTRSSQDGLGPEFTEVNNSIVTYGLPDLTSLNAITPQQRSAVGKVLEEVVARFEPRLRDVHAVVLDPPDGPNRTL